MAQHGWERQYLAALLTSKTKSVREFESLKFFSSIVSDPHNGVQELLLHRLIAGLETVPDALALLDTVRKGGWDSYAPRILARIADTEAVLADRPELAEYFQSLRESTGYTTYSLNDWRLLGDGTNVKFSGAPVWAGNTTSIADVLPDVDLNAVGIDEVTSVLEYFFDAQIRIFQLAIITFSAEHEDWAQVFHRVLTAPYIAMDSTPAHDVDEFIHYSPAAVWSPHWQVSMTPRGQAHWNIHEAHTGQELQGLGAATIFDQISVLLAVTGLLREGINLSPIDVGLTRPLIPSHPIWGFRRREFSAARTIYQADDVRGVALGFLERLPATRRVSAFRSRLGLHFVSKAWEARKSASAVTAENGFYKQLIRAAQPLDQNRFNDVQAHIKHSPFELEPAFQFLYHEATAALRLFEVLATLPKKGVPATVPHPEEILCVTHASVPDQTGGYAIRAHGILRSLKDHGISISAVTRPGFPSGALTESSTVTVDEVEYVRLPATGVTRSHGEIQYMMSFVEPFKQLFKEKGIGTIHTRSTFLIALPALIAARELGLNVLYEVSGLWELVYQDREHESNLLKRSPFAELAETSTMTRADQLVVMNEAVQEIAIARGVSAERVQIAHNAVDVESFTPIDSPQNDVFTIGYLGSFADYEGFDDIIDVVKLLKSQDFEVRLIMVGDGLRYNHIKSRVINEGLEHDITLTGRIPHAQVAAQYQQINVMVYPRHSTGATETITPLKPFEALAMAKPIIVSDVQPLREIVGDDERGLVFESGNIDDFARAIRRLASDPHLRSTLGDAGRQWVVENRTWRKVVETFLETYDRLR